LPHPLAPTLEQESLRALRSLVIDVYERGDADTARRLPIIAYRIANSASRRKSERLLQNALDIWIMELALLPRTDKDAVQRAVADLVAETSSYTIAGFTGQMENDYAPLEERLGALPFLGRLARFEAQALKLHTDRHDRESFKDAYLRWSDAWFRHWTPENRVAELEFFDHTRDREIARQLDEARRLSEAKAEALRAHSGALLELGAWMAYERRRDRMDGGDFSFFSRFLVGVIRSRYALVDELARIATAEDEPSLLEHWDLSSAETGRPGRVITGVAGRDVLRFWLTILLSRFMTGSTGDADHRPEGLPDWLVEEMRGHLQAIEEQWEKWHEVVADHANIERAREWLDEEERRSREAGRLRIAEAPLDPSRVGEFVTAQINNFEREALVRTQVIRVGAFRPERETDPERGLRRIPYRRDLFVEGGPLMVGIGQFGTELAREVDRALYTALSDAASPAPGSDQPVEGIIAVATQMIEDGLPPDAVLAPAPLFMIPQLYNNARFRWRSRQAVNDPGGPAGYIDTLPIYDDVGPQTAAQVVVVHFRRALTLVERRPPSAEGPVQVEVSEYSRERATELVSEGFSFRDQPDWPEEHTIEGLVRNFVEVSIHLDYEVVLQDDVAESARRLRVEVERDSDVDEEDTA
jgi:hypothetical protein